MSPNVIHNKYVNPIIQIKEQIGPFTYVLTDGRKRNQRCLVKVYGMSERDGEICNSSPEHGDVLTPRDKSRPICIVFDEGEDENKNKHVSGEENSNESVFANNDIESDLESVERQSTSKRRRSQTPEPIFSESESIRSESIRSKRVRFDTKETRYKDFLV